MMTKSKTTLACTSPRESDARFLNRMRSSKRAAPHGRLPWGGMRHSLRAVWVTHPAVASSRSQ
jgi:hypothetical protein